MEIYNNLTSGILAAIVVVTVIKVILWIVSIKKFNRHFKDFPQAWDEIHPIFGNLLNYPGPSDEGLTYQREHVKMFSRFSVYWFAAMPMVYVSHPDLLKIILKSSEPKGRMYRLLHPWLGTGLLTSNGNKWARNRRLLTPAFHFDILKGYLQLKNNLSDNLLAKFERSCKSGDTLNVFDCISMFTLDVILQSTMSYETGCQKDGAKHPYILAVDRIGRRIVSRFLKPWIHSDLLYFITPSGLAFMKDCKYVHQVAGEIITKRRKQLESGNAFSNEEHETAETQKKHHDFLDTLITARDEDGNGLTNKEIRDEVDTFLFEGHDTTASAISWSLYSIAEHSDIQQRVQAEVDGVFQGRESDYLLWEDISRLPYLTMVVKESMRLHTPVPFMMRCLTKEIVLDGHTVPTGANINICIYNVHHNPATWDNSMKFDPERFSPENTEKRSPFAFIPFSAGPRNCIGQNFAMDEIKVAIARILHRYEISLDPSHQVKKYEGLVMKADTDIKIFVKPRQP